MGPHPCQVEGLRKALQWVQPPSHCSGLVGGGLGPGTGGAVGGGRACCGHADWCQMLQKLALSMLFMAQGHKKAAC